MIYTSCSIDEVIGRVIRNTRVQDTAFIIDMNEWIPEAMDMMRTQMQYSPAFEDVIIKFHKGRLPCGLIYIEAVEYKGMRIPYGNSVKNIKTSQQLSTLTNEPPVFTSVPYKTITANDANAYASDLNAALCLPEASDVYYQTELDHILTSFEEGCVRIHFVKTPTDVRGLPLIPDNGDYKEALYWYTRQKMIEAGFNDRVFKWEHCNAKYEFYAARAITDIEYPSPDQMESRVKTLTRFIAPPNYFGNFFRVQEGEKQFDTI